MLQQNIFIKKYFLLSLHIFDEKKKYKCSKAGIVLRNSCKNSFNDGWRAFPKFFDTLLNETMFLRLNMTKFMKCVRTLEEIFNNVCFVQPPLTNILNFFFYNCKYSWRVHCVCTGIREIIVSLLPNLVYVVVVVIPSYIFMMLK